MNPVRTLIQRARHLAAANNGGGALFSEANPNSKRGRGDVMKRRRWPIIFGAISGKLDGASYETTFSKYGYIKYLRTNTVVAFNAASCTKLSDMGESVLNNSNIRPYSWSSRSWRAKQQMDASFCRTLEFNIYEQR
jgi:hypothetical protein